MQSGELIHRLQDAWTWWSGELLSLVPAPIKQRLGQARPALLIEVNEDVFNLLGLDGDGRRAEDFGSLTSLAELSEQVPRAKAEVGESAQLILAWPSSKGLQVETRYPSGVAAQLPSIIRFDIDKLTPFAAEQVHLGHKVTGRAGQEIIVQIDVLPRAVTKDVLHALASHELVPDRMVLDPWEPMDAPNLAPSSTETRTHAAWLPWAWAGAAAGLAALLVVPAILATIDLSKVQKELMAYEAESLRLLSVHRALVEKRQTEQVLADTLSGDVSTLNTLKGVTDVLPDTAYLTHLSIGGGEVELRGFSADAASLIGVFEAASWVREARFEGSIVADERRGLERFTLKLTMAEDLS